MFFFFNQGGYSLEPVGSFRWTISSIAAFRIYHHFVLQPVSLVITSFELFNSQSLTFFDLVNLGQFKWCFMSFSIRSVYRSVLSFMGSYTSNFVYDHSS